MIATTVPARKREWQQIPEWIFEKYTFLKDLVYLDTQADGQEGRDACEECNEFINEILDKGVFEIIGFAMESDFYDEDGNEIEPDYEVLYTDAYGWSEELYRYPNGEFAFKGFAQPRGGILYFEVYAPGGTLWGKWHWNSNTGEWQRLED
jgi:hypothetical protein